MSWRLREIRIKLILDLQNNLVERETCERLEEQDQAIYEDCHELAFFTFFSLLFLSY